MTELIDGKALAQKMQQELAAKVNNLKQKKGIVPGLAVILVGDDPASQVYVRNKERAALTVGFKSETVRLSEFICQEELIAVIERYNADNTIHGILVQLPLPNHINDKKIILAIDPKKDVDGFHPMNTGHLWSGRPLMVPCTPSGIMELLREYNVNLEGKHAVIIGRSNIVGKPMAQLLLDKNATVTLTHSRTRQ
ncbi:TPA: bifunctional methylenetetrahydrofolate dehydrogenase/methenyltetrahydrofolate cyclohydrolase, partial [Streptococcus pyogenes]|nr:bifunctional methylenetetrahydrofolate dehydrogenase/methenyltetrahydrofolate cyclohydrolase [Streptococcus pyogenes]